jgi:glycosyltransferase involved in cell wall biosynthesis
MLSVLIISKNEARNIRRCLESACFADEIIVLDSGSQDDTLAIAREYTDQVFSNEDWQGYGIQKQRALLKTSGDWILNLDADEVISPALKAEIEQAVADNRADAYRVPIQMYFYGKPLKYSAGPKRHTRLFKRAQAAFSDDLVHEKILLPQNARIKKLKNPILHHSFHDVSHALYKMNRYSSLSASIRKKSKKSATFFGVMASSGWMFFRCYFLQRGFLDGKAGFLFATLAAQGSFYRGIKQLYPDE